MKLHTHDCEVGRCDLTHHITGLLIHDMFHTVQARMEAVGQGLLRRCQEGSMSALGLVRVRGRRASVAADAYEEHLVLHGDAVALLTNRRLLCLRAPGFAAVHARAEGSGVAIPMSSIPVAELKWAVEWQVAAPCWQPLKAAPSYKNRPS